MAADSRTGPGHDKTSGQIPHELNHSSSGIGAVVYLACPVNMRHVITRVAPQMYVPVPILVQQGLVSSRSLSLGARSGCS